MQSRDHAVRPESVGFPTRDPTTGRQIRGLRHALNDNGVRFGSNDPQQLLPAMVRYLPANSIRGEVFTASVSSKHPLHSA
jgi:hypothetical protein